MCLPRERWLSIVLISTLLALLGDATYVYGVKFRELVHSDAACTVLIAANAVEAHAPVAPSWYFANGDVWVWTPQLLAMLPVAIMGVGLESLRITELVGFGLELVALYLCFRRLTRRPWVAALASTTTLLALSKLHVLFAYVELSYGFIAASTVVIVSLLTPRTASSVATDRARVWRRWVAGTVFFFVFALNNPVRTAIFTLAPLLLAAIWPWRNLALRARATLAGLSILGWGTATLVYKYIFEPNLTFSPHPGHTDFVVQDLAGVLANIRMFGRGLVVLAGEASGDFSVTALPGLIVIGGAFAFVGFQVLGRRALTRERFLCVVVLAQFGTVLAPCLLGNLLLNPLSTRYIMPAFLPSLGLGVVIAVRAAARGPTWLVRFAKTWLALLPVVAVLGFIHTTEGTLEGDNLQWANRASHTELANELSRRGLTHGFATYWNANLVTLLSNGSAKTCPVFVGESGFVPQKWNSDVQCFERTRLPGRFFVVAAAEERDAVSRAIRAALPSPSERFMVGDSFEVTVLQLAEEPLRWLDLPLPVGKALRFPLRLPATHEAIRRGVAIETNDGLVATGETGTVIYGPHLRIPKGSYTVRWIGSGVESPGDLVFDVSAEGGRTALASHGTATAGVSKIQHGELQSLDFTLSRETLGIEFRIFSQAGAKVAIEGLVVEKR